MIEQVISFSQKILGRVTGSDVNENTENLLFFLIRPRPFAAEDRDQRLQHFASMGLHDPETDDYV